MINFFGNIFSFLFGTKSWLATIIISMFPIIELKGAIPVGMSTDFWGEHALNSSQAFICSLIGSCLVVPILALIFRPLINYLKKTRIFKSFGNAIDRKVSDSSIKISNKYKNNTNKKMTTFLKMLGVFMFVALPLPLTGVWTGTCIGVVLGLKFYQTVFSVVLGNIVAGFVVTCVCSILPQFTTIIFLIVLAIVILIFSIFLIKTIMFKRKNSGENVVSNK